MKKNTFNDNWRFGNEIVTLPHDAMLHEVRSADAPSGSGGAFFAGGSYIYEKSFMRPDAEHVLIQFEGVYKNAKVFINGRKAGGVAYGYIPFFICADDYLIDGENIIRVECDTREQPESRWYSGAGIYRPVWLWTGPKDSIEPESVQISTLSYDPAKICIDAPMAVQVEVAGIIGQGKHIELDIPDAKLWSEDTPYLYTCKVKSDNDEDQIKFGIRKVEWSSKGLFINGRETLLRGGCLHHDNGILGAATYDESEYRRVRLMKEAGYNAIRSAHNPCSRAMLEACDELGIYMMDESWDMWFRHKSKFDYASHWQENYIADLRAMVNRDFNHPSVIMYSIGNEVSEPASDDGLKVARKIVDFLHEADSTRAVTGGMNLMIIASSKKGKGVYGEEGGRNESSEKKLQGMSSLVFNMITNIVGTGMNKAANSKAADLATTSILDMLDLAGYNYASGRYPLEGKAHPDRIIYGSETFPHDIVKNWAMVRQYPYLIGDFMWTAIDYLGETGAGAWAYSNDGKGFSKPYPWLLADMGAMDILGDPNGELFHAAAVWGKLKHPVICVQPVNHNTRPAKSAWRGTNAIPSWSWKDCEGRKAVVEVYFDADTVELQLNGKSFGKKKTKACKTSFKTKYVSGTLTAIAYSADGKELGRDALLSAENEKIAVHPEKTEAKAGEIIYVPVTIEGTNRVVESNADRKLFVSVEGGELLGFGSANPRTKERFDDGEYTTYYGRALLIVRRCTAGTMQIVVTDGAETVETKIIIRKPEA